MTLQMHYQEKFEEGVEQGLKQGVEQGLIQGSEQEKVKTAKRMLEGGNLPVNEIALYSGLALEKVLELQKEMQLM